MNPPPMSASVRYKSKKLKRLASELSSDDEHMVPVPSTSSPSILGHSQAPWAGEFNRYLDSHDEVDEKISLVQWWGVRPLFRFMNIWE